jgi:hypothetical protein
MRLVEPDGDQQVACRLRTGPPAACAAPSLLAEMPPGPSRRRPPPTRRLPVLAELAELEVGEEIPAVCGSVAGDLPCTRYWTAWGRLNPFTPA